MNQTIRGGVRLFVGLGLSVLAAVACSDSGDDPGQGPASGDPCKDQYDALVARCNAAEDRREIETKECHSSEFRYRSMGCQDEFDAWLVCTSKPGYNCDDDTGCESSQSGYFTCESRSTSRTGCASLGQRSECTDASKPYAFGCLGTAPASCVKVSDAGAGLYCCPALG